MKYPISLNDLEIEEVKKLGRLMGIENIHNVYGSIPRILKFGISFSLQTFERIENVIPMLEPATLEILLSAIKKRKVLEYHQKRQEFKQNKKKVV